MPETIFCSDPVKGIMDFPYTVWLLARFIVEYFRPLDTLCILHLSTMVCTKYYCTHILLLVRPCNLKSSIFHLDPSNSLEENDAFAKAAKEDWEQILLCRAKELAAGAVYRFY